MCKYASITLNMIEYACLYLKKQHAEYARILNVSDAVHSISLYKIAEQLSRQTQIQNTVKHLRWGVAQNE